MKAKQRTKPKNKKYEISLQEKQIILTEQQTLLSKERTTLSFIRTGLAFIAVGVAIINFMVQPAFQIMGWALVLIGFVGVLESYRRLSTEGKKMKKIKKELGER